MAALCSSVLVSGLVPHLGVQAGSRGRLDRSALAMDLQRNGRTQHTSGVMADGLRTAASAMLAALLLVSPVAEPMLPTLTGVGIAHAKELSSGSGSRVNKDPLSLLRLGLPQQTKEVRELQAALEDSNDSLTRLLFGNAKSAIEKAKGAASGSKATAIIKSAPAGKQEEATALLASISDKIGEISTAVGAGNAQTALAAEGEALSTLSKLEELVASGYKQPALPSEFKDLPYLKGRAEIALTLVPGKLREAPTFDVEGKLYKTIDVKMIVDGYTAPITAGNFVDLVQNGFYNDFKIQRSDGFVVQTGDPSAEGKGEKHGYVPEGKEKERRIPLEVYVKGDKAPIYGTTFDDDGRGGYAAVLPFNAYGALGMAREEYDADSASSQWFWLLFDSDLTPAGKNLLDGRYACFGYTIDGKELLSDVKEGDIIKSATVVKGLENLVKPA